MSINKRIEKVERQLHMTPKDRFSRIFESMSAIDLNRSADIVYAFVQGNPSDNARVELEQIFTRAGSHGEEISALVVDNKL